MVDQIFRLPNVKAVRNSTIVELKGTSKLEKVVTATSTTKETRELQADAIFIEIGYVAKTQFLRGIVTLNSKNEVEVDNMGNTSRPGIFAAGDITDTPHKQAVISAGQGCAAALTAYNYIQRLRGKTASRADWRAIKPVAKAK